MHKLLFFATTLALASANKVLAECCSCRSGDNTPENEWMPVPRVSINNLVVPSNVKPDSEDAILDCDYGYVDDREGLMVRWLYDNPDDPEELLSNLSRKKHLVYQWIPPHKPEAFGLLKNKVDLIFKATLDPFAEHRAIRILSPEPAMSGVYTCVVSTIHSQDEKAKRMTVGGTLLEPKSTLLSSSKLFRQGYKYNNVTQAFYKLHLLKLVPWKAYQKCLSERGTLAEPSNQEEIKQLNMMIQPLDLEPLLVGDDNRTINETDLEVCVFRFVEERGGYTFKDSVYKFGEIHRRPFACKLEAKNVAFDERCGPGYEYYDNVKSCYKLFTDFISWYEAYSECQGQDAHLLVLNSKAESETIKEYLRKFDNASYAISVGIREVMPVGRHRVFKTIFNEPLEEAGYYEWIPGEREPSTWRRGGNTCGAINLNGEYTDIPCTYRNNFLCEKELHLGPNYRLPSQL